MNFLCVCVSVCLCVLASMFLCVSRRVIPLLKFAVLSECVSMCVCVCVLFSNTLLFVLQRSPCQPSTMLLRRFRFGNIRLWKLLLEKLKEKDNPELGFARHWLDCGISGRSCNRWSRALVSGGSTALSTGLSFGGMAALS